MGQVHAETLASGSVAADVYFGRQTFVVSDLVDLSISDCPWSGQWRGDSVWWFWFEVRWWVESAPGKGNNESKTTGLLVVDLQFRAKISGKVKRE